MARRAVIVRLAPMRAYVLETGREESIVPTVDYSDLPRVRIYDAKDDGSFWFRQAGFTRKFNEE